MSTLFYQPVSELMTLKQENKSNTALPRRSFSVVSLFLRQIEHRCCPWSGTYVRNLKHRDTDEESLKHTNTLKTVYRDA